MVKTPAMGRIMKGDSDRKAVVAAPPITDDVAGLLAAARAEANRERAAAKDAAIVLARKMAEKIVGHAVAVDAAVLRDIAARALAAVKPGKEAVLLRVHPDDLARLAAERAAWLTELGVQAEVKLVADPAVGRSGCVVETAVGRLDARLDTQLDALERALRKTGLGRA
jgi:flagellar assembly protein FliH